MCGYFQEQSFRKRLKEEKNKQDEAHTHEEGQLEKNIEDDRDEEDPSDHPARKRRKKLETEQRDGREELAQSHLLLLTDDVTVAVIGTEINEETSCQKLETERQ